MKINNSHEVSEEKNNAIEYCAGIPLASKRNYSKYEIRKIKSKIKILTFSIFFLVTACIVAFVAIISFLDGVPPKASFRLALFFLYQPVLLFTIYFCVTRYNLIKILQRALKSGAVKVFYGKLGLISAKTSKSLKKIKNLRLKNENYIETFFDDDAIYSVNGLEIDRIIDVDVCAPVMSPKNPASYAIPKNWFFVPKNREIERRRLSVSELNEIMEYAVFKRKQDWQFYLVLVFFLFILTLFFLRIGTVFCLDMRLLVSFILVSGISILIYEKIKKYNQVFFDDFEVGWAIIVHYAYYEDEEKSVFEYLACSGRLWTINSQPSPWRQNTKLEKSVSFWK